MAITCDWANKIVLVPRADMTLVQSTPTEIRELDLNQFRLRLKELEAEVADPGAGGMAFDDIHQHQPPVTVGGVELARVVEIINDYTITFEDGQYAVNLIGANSNAADRVNVNQVSVRASNSAGLVTSAAIEYGEYGGGVTVDTTATNVGTVYPIGTNRAPVNNFSDALLIASSRGFNKIFLKDSAVTIDNGLDFTDLTFIGQSEVNTAVTVDSNAVVNDCTFEKMFIQGTLDGGSTLRLCSIGNLQYVNGIIENCIVDGPIGLAGTTECILRNCVSGVAGQQTPTIDMGGDGPPLMIREWSGGVRLINKTGTTYPTSIDLISGQVKLDSSLTAGNITVRGVGKLIDSSNGALVFAEILNLDTIPQNVWNFTTRTLTTGGGISDSSIANAVWNALADDHKDSDSFGELMNAMLTVGKYLALAD